MKEKNHVVPNEILNKEFLSQFKTEADVSKFLKHLHAQILEKMLEGEMDAHLGYEKNSFSGHYSGNSRNGSYPKKIQTEHGEAVIPIPRGRNGQFEPIVVPKHESCGLSLVLPYISYFFYLSIYCKDSRNLPLLPISASSEIYPVSGRVLRPVKQRYEYEY